MEVDDALPGADLIRDGLRDIANGVESIPALLVLIGGPRLRGLGFDVPDVWRQRMLKPPIRATTR